MPIYSRGGGAVAISSATPLIAALITDDNALADALAQVEAAVAVIGGSKAGTRHHGSASVYNVTDADTDWEIHAEGTGVAASGAIHFNGSVLTADTFSVWVVNTSAYAQSITFANLAGAFERIGDTTAQAASPYTLASDAAVRLTITNNAGLIYLNIFPFGSADTAPLVAALAGLSARLDGIQIPDDSPHAAAIAGIVARLDTLEIPDIGAVVAALAGLVARIDALQVPNDPVAELEALADAVAKVESDLGALVIPDTSAIVASLAGLVARVELLAAADVDVSPLVAALSGIVARLDGIQLPSLDPALAAIAGIVARFDALATPEVEPIAAALAGLSARMEAQAPVETAPIVDSLAGLAAKGEVLVAADSIATLERQSLADAVAELGSALLSGRTFGEIEVPEFALTAATGVYEPVPGTDFMLQPGAYRITVFGGAAMLSAVAASTLRIRGRLWNVTANAIVGREQLCGGNYLTTRVLTTFSHTYRVNVVAETAFRYEGARQFVNTPTESIIFGHAPAGIILVEELP